MKKIFQFSKKFGGSYEEGESYDELSEIVVAEDKLQSLKEAVIKEINSIHFQWQEIVNKALATKDVKEFFTLLCMSERFNFEEWKKEGGYEYFFLNVRISYLKSLQLPIDDIFGKSKDIDNITKDNISDINEVCVTSENDLEKEMTKMKKLLVMKREVENWKPITEFPEDIKIVEVFLYE